MSGAPTGPDSPQDPTGSGEQVRGPGNPTADRGRLDYSGNPPVTGQTSMQAAGSVRQRLLNPGEQSSGGNTRGSEITVDDFQQTDSRAQLHRDGRGEEQLRPTESRPGVTPPMASGSDPISEEAARRGERLVSLLFLLSLVGTIGFVLTYVFWDFAFQVEKYDELYTPLLGVCMALALGGIGAGAVVWAKTLMEDEEVVQERHAFGSKPADRAAVVETLKTGAAKSQFGRRTLLRNTLLLSVGALAVLPVPLLFSLGPFQNKERVLRTTAWGQGVRLIRKNGTPVNRDDLEVGGVESVFPDVPRGTRIADSSALLIRMLPEELNVVEGREDWVVDGYIAYSALCSHLGCPVKLYEQQTHHLLCPCHQSTFAADEGARVLFGPAARPLSQLAISVDDEGYFFAQGDFTEPVGPSYWER